MKREELEALGLTKEQVDKVLDAHHAELDPVQKELEDTKGELKVANEKLETHETTITKLEGDLKKYDGVDLTALNKEIEDLKESNRLKDESHAKEIADRDFNNLVEKRIVAANGKNLKAISALLDLEALRASKNQEKDLDEAIKLLTEAEDSSMLFGKAEPAEVSRGSFPGLLSGSNSGDVFDAQMRAAMGLPPQQTQN